MAVPNGVKAFSESQLQRCRWSSKINPGVFHLYGLRFGFPRRLYSGADLGDVMRAAADELRPWCIAKDGEIIHVAGHIPPFIGGDN